MAKINSWDDESVKDIALTVRRLELQVRNLQSQLELAQFANSPPETTLFVKPSAALPAYDKATKKPGEGDCKVWRHDGLELVETERTIKVRNYLGVKIKTELIAVDRHFQTSKWKVAKILYATRCNALLKGAYTSGGSTITVDNVTPLDGTSPVDSSSDELTVTMRYVNWPDMDNNAILEIGWDGTEERWQMVQADCGA